MPGIIQLSKLALHGGKPVRQKPFPRYNTIGPEEKRAANSVLDSGILSEFVGVWGEYFNGGPQVRGLERAWADYFHVKHAVTFNSNTSGLFASIGALGLGPGDEVIVSPYTMSASAIAPAVYGATPVFADIDPETYCLSPASIRAVLTPRTKAILAVDLFGHPANFDEIRKMAEARGIRVIEDAAQAPGAQYRGRWAGT
ncbi:MAG: DegT/DnrJ/EryC1/StrS family aminotransferase, partial [Chloroflexi bacterium]|nr:DegT/DnrJ/EryC1/StrS family aminotransferase [Chloroflexota bacterium]